MLAAVLQTAGYKTGLYTSPHLKDFRERIRINGKMISKQQVINFVAAHRQDFDEIKPSFFEMTVGLAFQIFVEEKVDIAVIEVGLGGRLDSTNIITPLLSIITNIGWDHMNILGDSLQLIAGEKAGIIKPKVPVIIGEYQPEVAGIFIEKAKQENSSLIFASETYNASLKNKNPESIEIEITQKPATFNLQPSTLNKPLTFNFPLSTSSSLNTHHSLTLDLPGTYQLKNVKAVLCAVDELRNQGFKITMDAVETALKQVKTLTGLHGRWETIKQKSFNHLRYRP